MAAIDDYLDNSTVLKNLEKVGDKFPDKGMAEAEALALQSLPNSLGIIAQQHGIPVEITEIITNVLKQAGSNGIAEMHAYLLEMLGLPKTANRVRVKNKLGLVSP